MEHWFAFYYIPPAGSAFYRLGSELLGYDVRAGRVLNATSLRPKLADVPSNWAKEARPFGFHMTITEALSFDPEILPEIEKEIGAVLGSFRPESEMSLTFKGLVQWKEGEVWVLRYDPSRALDVLQAVMVARLARFGKSSMFFEEIEAHPERYSEPYERRRLETFLSPRGLDTWPAHFTLLNPHPRGANPELEAVLKETFAFEQLKPETFSLVLKKGDSHWRVHRDYAWPVPAADSV